ncbi:aldehyde dehydrogenase family protein, partial [Celeribacter sp.]|uniref:aldehyde dehydrogenase family protein n=1 Tax=Celeribacter sp. TaxID=1890673 RepID=UPI003A8DE6E4
MSLDLLIGGTDVAAAGAKTYDRIDPVTGDVATVAAAASVADALKAVASAEAAFAAWSATGPEARRKVLVKAGDIMEARAAEFVEAMVTETGATEIWAGF